MVDRIVAAGRSVLVTDGYDAFSTNRVAAAAGVSPGSVYQYFPDKAAIVDVVVDRYWDDVAEKVAAALADRIGTFGPAMVRETADALLGALEDDPAVLRVVAEELPISRNRDRLTVLERRVRDLVSTFLAARPESSHRPDPAVTAWVVVIALEQLAVRWVLDQPPVTREQVVEEILALVSGYLSFGA